MWTLEFGTWSVRLGALSSKAFRLQIPNPECGTWNLESGVWSLEFGVGNQDLDGGEGHTRACGLVCEDMSAHHMLLALKLAHATS